MKRKNPGKHSFEDSVPEQVRELLDIGDISISTTSKPIDFPSGPLDYDGARDADVPTVRRYSRGEFITHSSTKGTKK
jgi:hypothetical protein